MAQVVFNIVERLQQIPKEIKWNEINEEVAEQGYIKVTIQNFSGLRDTRAHYFNSFELAGKLWRLLLFPMGNNCDGISLYLDFIGPNEVGKWATCAEFVIGLIGEEDQFYQKEAHHRFVEEDLDWGFHNYISKNIFYNEEKGKRFVVDDTVTFIIAIKVFQDPTGVLWHNFVKDDKEEQNVSLPVRLVTSQIAKNHHGTDLSLFNAKSEGPNVALNMKVGKDLSFQEFRVLLAEQFGFSIERQRIWGMAKRQNGTIRVDECLSRFNKETMQQIRDILKISELRFFLEESNVDPMEEDTTEYFKKFDPNEDILIFVKSYNPSRSLLQYEGHYILKRTQTLLDLIVTINTQLGRPASHPLKLYEEVRPTMIDPIKPDQTFQDHEISTGDIVVYQDLPTDKGQNDFEFLKAPQYYEHLQNSIVVNFRSRNQPKDPDSQFTLQLSKKMKYDAVAKKVGETIGITPDKILFISHGQYIDVPKREFKYNPETTLEEMLQPGLYELLTNILYYEKLEIPITEMETKQISSVTWINKMGKELEEIALELECSLCKDIYREPKTLGCLHSFCLECLETYYERTHSNVGLKCPICRTPFQSQSVEQLSNLPTDSFLLNTLNTYNSLNNSISQHNYQKVMCSDEENEATHYCLDCKEYLCEVCTSAHKTVRLTKNHQLTPIEDVKDEDQINVITNLNSQLYCQIHQKEEIKLFCNDCKETICSLCVPLHPSHKILLVTDVIGNQKQSLIDLINEVKPKEKELREGINNCEEMIKQLEINSTTTQSQINQLFNKIRAKLDEKEQELLNKLDEIEKHKKKELEIQKEELKFGIESIIGSCKMIENSLSLSTSNDARLLSMRNLYHSRLDYLSSNQWKVEPCHHPFIEFSISEKEEQSIYSSILDIGRIDSNEISPEKCLVLRNENEEIYENEEFKFEILSFSKEGDIMKKGGNANKFKFEIEGESKSKYEWKIKYLNNGKYEVKMKLKDEGVYLISVECDGKSIKPSPFQIQVSKKQRNQK